MYARVTEIQFDPSRRDDALRISEQDVIPAMREEQDFEHIYVLADMESGKGVIVTLWSSQEGEQASRATIASRFAKLGDIMTAPPSPSKVYEVVSHG